MKKDQQKFFIILALLLLACAVSWNFYFKMYSQQDTVSIHKFPTTIGEWSSKEIPLTSVEYAILETKNAFTRKYSTPSGKEVYLFIVYSQSNRKVSHPPEICYTGSGMTLLTKKPSQIQGPVSLEPSAPVQSIDVDSLLLEKDNFRQLAFYWFKVGDSFTPNYWKQQILIAFKSLLGKPSSSALIRVSASISNQDQKATEKELQEFSAVILPYLSKYLP